MNATVRTRLESMHRPRAVSPSATLAGRRNPNPTAVVNAIDQRLVEKSARAPPATSELRAIGSDSSRSVNPWASSSATPTAVALPVNNTIVATYPGTS